MKNLTSHDLRKKFLDYFESLNHKIIKSSSLIPENDPTVLFTTAGMHPLVPFLMGENHPYGKRLCSIQKCIRTSDIDVIGDETHLTFFEMLGNWSLGDYFKKESLKYSLDFLTNEKHLNINLNKLYFTCFEGDETLPKDEESYNVLINLGIDKSHIFYLGKEDNFWILGSGVGPCGPDTEIFFDTDKDKCGLNCKPGCGCGKYVEIWNNVFMEFLMDENNNLSKLPQQNVDTGMGLERTIAVLNNSDSVYETDLFSNIKNEISNLTSEKYENNLKDYRIIMDHVRSSVFILGDENSTLPSNIGAGYVLRRLIRRAIRSMIKLNIEFNHIEKLALIIIDDYAKYYPELNENKDLIINELSNEAQKFNNTLKGGEKLFRKIVKNTEGKIISGTDAFKLFDTFGFPIEMTEELAKEMCLSVDIDGFNKSFELHQERSKTLSKGSAKGGLADSSQQTIRYHTLAHILLQTLKEEFGEDVNQKGSNINSERIRFDFNLDHKMTDEEKEKVEKRVNEIIKKNLDVTVNEMSLDKAKAINATGIFTNKYDDIVKVYQIGDFSKEICGGPHVKNTSEIGEFKIIKEESVAAGIRRIRGVLE